MNRRGTSLLELLIATAIVAAVVTAASSLLRMNHSVWDAYDADVAKLESAHATLRQIVRQLRQCAAVSAITAPGADGALVAVDGSGEIYVWKYDGGSVYFGVDSADDLLAAGLDSISFTGYEADGTTTTLVTTDIRCVQCDVVVKLQRNASAAKSISCHAWLRSW